MFWTPLMACSRMTSTESTKTWALAPGKASVTTTLGGATLGNWEMGRVLMDNPPRNKMMIEITIASAGRRRNCANMLLREPDCYPCFGTGKVTIRRGISGVQQPALPDGPQIPLCRRREPGGRLQ